MRLAILATVCVLLLPASARAQQPSSPEPPEEEPPAVDAPAIGWARMPSLEEMEAAGAVIGEIRILPQNIFDLADPSENYLLYRLANILHIVTREKPVRDTLLFKSGEKLSVRLIEESERQLRAT